MLISQPIQVAHHLYGIEAERIRIFKNHNLTILTLNIWSLVNKLASFESFLKDSEINPSVICLNETWLKSCKKNGFNLEGYQSYHLTRKRTGGGTSIFIHKSLPHHPASIKKIVAKELINASLNNFKNKYLLHL